MLGVSLRVAVAVVVVEGKQPVVEVAAVAAVAAAAAAAVAVVAAAAAVPEHGSVPLVLL